MQCATAQAGGGSPMQPARLRAALGAALLAAGTAVLAQSPAGAPGDELRAAAMQHARLFSTAIEDGIAAAEAIAVQPEVVRLHQALKQSPRSQARTTELRAVANGALGRGFSLLEFRGADDGLLAAAVTVPADALLLFTLKHRHPVKLLWNGGFVLHVEVPIRAADGRLGTLYAQMPMPEFTPRPRALSKTAPPGTFFVCGRLNGSRRCMPEWQPSPAPGALGKIPHAEDPIERALAGETGIAESVAPRGSRKISAFAPVREVGLAVILSAELR